MLAGVGGESFCLAASVARQPGTRPAPLAARLQAGRSRTLNDAAAAGVAAAVAVVVVLAAAPADQVLVGEECR